ncbi:MAG: hypothetical protein HUU20_19695 [Pirellulales bacterium]|nr:hypothetical protein [Pirellulales bacterium]
MILERGLSPQQTIFVEILLDAYDASGQKQWLEEAESLAARVLRDGRDKMRIEGGQAGRAFLRLATALHPVCRLELALKQPGSGLKITRDGRPCLDAKVPADIAVVYLPRGTYVVEVDGQRQEWTGNPISHTR